MPGADRTRWQARRPLLQSPRPNPFRGDPSCSMSTSPSPPCRNPARSCCWWRKAAGGGATGELWQAADAATGGAITRALTAAEFKGKKGQSATVLAPGAGLSRVVAVGLGKLGELTQRGVEEAGGHAAAALAPSPRATLAATGLAAAAGAHPRHRRGAAQLPLRPLPHQGKSRRTSRSLRKLALLAHDTGRRQGGMGADAGGGRGRLSHPRPGQRARQRAEPGGDGRALRGAAASSA